MDQERAEIEKAFALCEKAHKDCVRIGQISFVLGVVAVVLCAVAGVLMSFRGRPIHAFVEFFLCLLNFSLVRNNRKRHKEDVERWREFESSHKFLMEHWDDFPQEEGE